MISFHEKRFVFIGRASLINRRRLFVPKPGTEWWWETYVGVGRELEGKTSYQPRRPRLDFCGPIWRFVEEQVPKAWDEGLTVEEVSDRCYSGAYLLETVPTVLYILARHGHDPEKAILRAVNDTMDNDTVGAIVGAAVGAFHGRARLPERWISGLLGRTREADDGRVFELIDLARGKLGQ